MNVFICFIEVSLCSLSHLFACLNELMDLDHLLGVHKRHKLASSHFDGPRRAVPASPLNELTVSDQSFKRHTVCNEGTRVSQELTQTRPQPRPCFTRPSWQMDSRLKSSPTNVCRSLRPARTTTCPCRASVTVPIYNLSQTWAERHGLLDI